AMLDSIPPVYGTGTVYKNQIYHASMGLQVQGYNGASNSTDGLEVMCNEFDELVNYDFILSGRTASPAVNTEIRNQGICDPFSPQLKATNFYLSSCDSTSQQNQAYYNSSANDYLYSDKDATRPICRNVTYFGCPPGHANNPCSSHLSSRPYFTSIIFNYATATTNHEAAKHELDSLVDGWKALGLGLWSSSPPPYYSMFMTYSPWLSDSTLLSLFDPDVRQYLADEGLVDILIANSGLSPEVYAAALNADPAIDWRFMDDLEAAQATPSVRILKEREWATWVFTADLAANEITEYALRTDSISTGISALAATARISEMQKLFMLQLAAREFADAGSMLGDINAAQGKETSWSILAAITLEQQQENRSWLRAGGEEVAVADSIWNANGDRAIGARTISAYYSGKRFSREPFGLESGERLGQFQPQSNIESSSGIGMKVYPNPADNSASVIVLGSAVAPGTTLEITNTLGQVIETITVKGTAPIELDLSQYAPGMLYLRLVSNGTCISTEKLLIVK
ncbi:MAG TPA: T9SS type A sorting domain-containing protein, partial [Chryseolinea sp.]|nr:T9SS type A sorting domain-containing protein [Chryseolinea sp.]